MACVDDGTPPTLSFLGGAGTVTGSKHLVTTARGRILLDCGLFQGLKSLRLRNWDRPPFDPAGLTSVVLSHAHLDHSGWLPVLVRKGFRGAIHCTSGTADLVGVVLRDAAKIQEEDAARANRHGYSKHRPALPLYTVEDVERTLDRLRPHPYGRAVDVEAGARVTFRRAAHILGSATVQLDLDEQRPVRLVFSGDLGRWHRPILRDPEFVPEADVLLVESTYGDRTHANGSEETLVRVIRDAYDHGGAVIVPAFAIGRTQELIWTLRKLEDDGRLPQVPVYIDSPMARSVTELYCEHPEDHDLDMATLMDERRCPLCCREYHVVRTTQESKALNRRPGPMVIIAGSGMATGGRVLHHLRHRLPDPRTTVLLPGFQAAGTRGRSLQEGAREVKIHGGWVPVRARIETLDGLSAHADQDEILRWLGGFTRPPAVTWLVHGEPAASAALALRIESELGWTVGVAEDGASVSLLVEPDAPARAGREADARLQRG